MAYLDWFVNLTHLDEFVILTQLDQFCEFDSYVPAVCQFDLLDRVVILTHLDRFVNLTHLDRFVNLTYLDWFFKFTILYVPIHLFHSLSSLPMSLIWTGLSF